MPFRSLYRQQMTPAEFQTPGALCIVHPAYEERNHSESYHEMDFTYPQNQQTISLTSASVPKYNTAMELDNDFSYPGQGRSGYLSDAQSAEAELRDAVLPYLQDLNATDLQSDVSSVRTNSMANGSTLEPSSSPIGASSDEKVCPLITGESETCHPDRCGPDAPCMKFATIPPIEECADVPCIALQSKEKAPKLERSSTEPTLPRPRSTRKASQDSAPKSTGKADAKRRAKQAHSLVEKKYRENLNAKLCQLHDTLKTTRYRPKKNREFEDEDSDEVNNVSACNGGKFRKGDVMDDALDYVNQTEVEMRHMENEIHRLRDMVGRMERRMKYEAARSGAGMMPMSMQVSPV